MRYVGPNTSDHLPNWAVNSGGPASNALSSLCNKTDATTGATLPGFTAKTFTWDGHGVSGTSNGTVVPDGIYHVTIQETWNHGSAGTTMQTYTFTKGPCEDVETPPGDSYFTGMSMVWEPTIVDTCLISLTCPTIASVTYTCSLDPTGIEKLTYLNPKFNIAPNPGTSEMNIQYNKATGIELMNTMGQIVYSEKLTSLSSGTRTLNVAQYPRGVYIVRVSNGFGTTGRKIVLTD